MLNEKTQERPSTTRRPKPWLIVLVGVLVLATIGIGAWAIIEATGSDEITVATQLYDDWTTAWNGTDPEAVASLFTDDGVHIPPSEPASWARLTPAVGRDGIRNHAEMCISYITDATRTGELTSIGGGRYTVPGEFVTDGTGWVATVGPTRPFSQFPTIPACR